MGCLEKITETATKLYILSHSSSWWQDTQRWKLPPHSIAQKSTSKKQIITHFLMKGHENSLWHSNNRPSSPCKYINTSLFFLVSCIQVTLSNPQNKTALSGSSHKRKWAFIFSSHRHHRVSLFFVQHRTPLPPKWCHHSLLFVAESPQVLHKNFFQSQLSCKNFSRNFFHQHWTWGLAFL